MRDRETGYIGGNISGGEERGRSKIVGGSESRAKAVWAPCCRARRENFSGVWAKELKGEDLQKR